MNAGIDYGMGRTNIDTETGIRYGCISQSSVLQVWCDSAEPDYGKPTCPECGNEVVEYDEEQHGDYDRYASVYFEYACETCEELCTSQDASGEEPQGWFLDDGEYKAEDCLDSDIILLKSPYYTFAPYCSPCVPGAGNLDDAQDSGGGNVKTYCFGHDWFEGEKAPYPVYSVETDKLVEA